MSFVNIVVLKENAKRIIVTYLSSSITFYYICFNCIFICFVFCAFVLLFYCVLFYFKRTKQTHPSVNMAHMYIMYDSLACMSCLYIYLGYFQISRSYVSQQIYSVIIISDCMESLPKKKKKEKKVQPTSNVVFIVNVRYIFLHLIVKCFIVAVQLIWKHWFDCV